MAFTLPNFNLDLAVWRSGNSPFIDPPDYDGLLCQCYVHSRMDLDTISDQGSEYSPPIILRIPTGFQPLDGDVYGVGGNSIVYYKIRWAHLNHWGFPNEYWHVIVDMVNDRGLGPIFVQVI